MQSHTDLLSVLDDTQVPVFALWKAETVPQGCDANLFPFFHA